MKYQLDAPYYIARFEKHTELKDSVLSAINNQKAFNRLTETEDAVDITRCDWNTSRWDYSKEWFRIIQKDFVEHMTMVSKELGYEFFRLKEIWFQQYEQNSHHGWHVHGSNWTNVYFLELPENSPKTQFINPYDQKTIAEFDIKEGDILTFPSFVIHRAPPNLSNNRKTIISWNMDTELVPGLYTE